MLKSLLPCLLVVFSSSAKYFSVPKSLRNKAVYYKRSKQLDVFSCGYNVLFNAANFEHHCGFSNKAHRYTIFKKQVVPYVRGRGHSTQGSSYNEMTEYLAYKRLKLQPFYHLAFKSFRPNGIGFSMTNKTHHTYPQAYSDRRSRHDGIITGIKRYLAINDHAVVHFLLYVNVGSEAHGILATIYKNESGRGLYLFDNLNSTMRERDDSTVLVKYICKEFNISSKDTFEGPVLPNFWPHLDRRPRR